MLDRDAYARSYGPTTGDRIRLGDSGLVVRVEDDATLPGDELLVGFGKTGRDGLMATAGAIDTHVHLLSPRIVDQALAAGITTMVAQDFGPVWNLGANPAYALRRMHGAMDAWPLNLALLARGSSSRPEPLESILIAGAAGLKIHEDVGAHGRALDTAVTVAEDFDVQVAVPT